MSEAGRVIWVIEDGYAVPPARLLALPSAIWDHWSTCTVGTVRKVGRVVGDGTWLTLGEAHERLKSEPHPIPISYQTLRRMVDRGEVPTTRIGSRRDRRVPTKAIEEMKERMWAEAHPPVAEPEPPTVE